MTYLNSLLAKGFIAAASIMVMASSAAAQDYAAQTVTTQTATPKSYVKVVELHVQAPQAQKFQPVSTPRQILAPTQTRTTRRIIREELPSRRHSVRTVSLGRIFTTNDHADNAMTVYKRADTATPINMPNHFKPQL